MVTLQRAAALGLIEHILHTLDESQCQWPASLVREVYVFGSFARGGTQPHDVDIDIEFDFDDRWLDHEMSCLSEGRNPGALLKKTLIGSKRGCEFTYNIHAKADFEMTLLWRKGDSIEASRERLDLITPDPSAGRAPRDGMLPQFNGIDAWIPRPRREALSSAATEGAITIERDVLLDGQVASETAREHINHRWGQSSPLHRAASAVVADWERRGISPEQAHLHGKDIHDKDTPYFAGFRWQYFHAIPACLTEYGGVEWIEVVRPTRTRSLDCLRIKPGNLEVLSALRMSWG